MVCTHGALRSRTVFLKFSACLCVSRRQLVGISNIMASILPLSSAKSALLRQGLLERAILRNCDGLFFSLANLVERKIHEKATCFELLALFQEYGAISSAQSEFMLWLQQWLTRMVYRDGNPFSRDRHAMGQALSLCLCRCADGQDYEVAEKLVLHGADLEERW